MTQTDCTALVAQIRSAMMFFNTSTAWLTEEDETFAPADGLFTASQQIAHVAQTVDWFVAGAFGSGWDLDFAAHEDEVREVSTLAKARDWLERATENAIQVIESVPTEKLSEPLPDGAIMPGAPRSAVVGGIVDHTAHHRGALSVYARLCGKTPPMPYA